MSAEYYPFKYCLDTVSYKGNHIIPPILKIAIKAWTSGKKVVEQEIELFYLTQVDITQSETETEIHNQSSHVTRYVIRNAYFLRATKMHCYYKFVGQLNKHTPVSETKILANLF